MEGTPLIPNENSLINKESNPEGKVFSSYMEKLSLNEEDLHKPLLDVATGDGSFVKYLRNKLGNNHAFGIDKGSIKLYNESDGLVYADGFKMPFADNSFEVVISKDFVPMFAHSINESAAIFDELIRVTKSGGKIISNISTPETIMEESSEEIYKEDSRFQEFFKGRYMGAIKLMEFMKGLEKVGFTVEYKRSGEDVAVVLKKP